jgi:hypothetical protein
MIGVGSFGRRAAAPSIVAAVADEKGLRFFGACPAWAWIANIFGGAGITTSSAP